MKNFNSTTWISLIVGMLIWILISIALTTYLPITDVILLLLFPIAIAVISAIIGNNDLKQLKKDMIKEYQATHGDFEKEMKVLKNEINNYIDKNRIVCHGTKYVFPSIDRSKFWNDLLIGANKKFILLGTTNKSWVTGGTDQSNRLGNAIIAILENNGEVKILSHDEARTIENHKIFIKKYILDKIGDDSTLLDKFQKHFTYKLQDNLNFTAVVSDDRLIILPRMNNEQNHEKCMVLEINRHTLGEIHQNYLSDIETIFDLAPLYNKLD